MEQETLGDRLKRIEGEEAGRKADRNLPLIARLDGRAFHTFTRGLNRPYDEALSSLMIDTTKYLVEETHATLGYTQSDEISLAWVPPAEEGAYLFDGKFQKLTSILSSLATSYFTKHLPGRIPSKAESLPTFDCRVWNTNSIRDLYLNFLWRQDDAIKNSISMAAQAHFSSAALHGMNSQKKIQMLEDKGHSWQALPEFFKSGRFVRRETKLITLSEQELDKIPQRHRPLGSVTRHVIVDFSLPLRTLENPEEVLFQNESPINRVQMHS